MTVVYSIFFLPFLILVMHLKRGGIRFSKAVVFH